MAGEIATAVIVGGAMRPVDAGATESLLAAHYCGVCGAALRGGVAGAAAYWLLCRPAVEKAREEWQDPTLYEETEHLSRLMTDIERERSVAPPTQRPLREVMEHEAVVSE